MNTCRTCDTNYDITDDGKCEGHSSATVIVIVCVVAGIVALASVGTFFVMQVISFSRKLDQTKKRITKTQLFFRLMTPRRKDRNLLLNDQSPFISIQYIHTINITQSFRSSFYAEG